MARREGRERWGECRQRRGGGADCDAGVLERGCSRSDGAEAMDSGGSSRRGGGAASAAVERDSSSRCVAAAMDSGRWELRASTAGSNQRLCGCSGSERRWSSLGVLGSRGGG